MADNSEYGYVSEENDSETSDENEAEEIENIMRKLTSKGKRKKKTGRKGQWPETYVDDLVDIILENDKFKEKLLLTNVKNVRNSQYYEKVIDEIKKRCAERDEEFEFDVNQTRQKFKRCVSICRNAVMKIKTASGIKRFQEDKALGNWFGKLLPVISSMDHCQPAQAIEPGSVRDDTEEAINANDDHGNETDDNGEYAVNDEGVSSAKTTPESSDSSIDRRGKKQKSYVPKPAPKRKAVKMETLFGEMKEAVSSLKTLASDNSSKEMLEFLKEESKRQSERDTAFLQLMSSMFQQQQSPVNHLPMQSYRPAPNLLFSASQNQSPSPEMEFSHSTSPSLLHPSHSPIPHQAGYSTMFPPGAPMNSQFRYGMTDMRASSTFTRPPSNSSEYSKTQGESFTEQLTNPDFP